MATHLSYKLALPRVEGQVLRTRQVEALTGALGHSPLVWLLGLPGAGKTSTAAQWVHASRSGEGQRCIWYRLDEDDADMWQACWMRLRAPPAPRRARAASGLVARQPARPAPLRAAAFFSAAGRRPIADAASHWCSTTATAWRRVPASSSRCSTPRARWPRRSPGRLRLPVGQPPPAATRCCRAACAAGLAGASTMALNSALEEASRRSREGASGRRWGAAEAQNNCTAAHGWMAHVLALARATPASGAQLLSADASGQVGTFLSARTAG